MACKKSKLLYVLILVLLLSFIPDAAAAQTTVIEVNENNLHFDASYVFVDITFDNIHELKVHTGKGTIEELANEVNAGFATNAIYWNFENKCKQIVFNGELINNFEGESICDYCVIYNDGTMGIIMADEVTSADQFPDNTWQLWTFGPALVHNGIAITDFSNCFKPSILLFSHPRTAIGYFGPNHFCFLTVAGRSSYNRGAFFKEMADFFVMIGCREAYNLDGGGSSHIWYKGEEYGKPSEDRVLSEIIYIDENHLQN